MVDSSSSSPDAVACHAWKRDWIAYYDAARGRPPRQTLLTALQSFDSTPVTSPSQALPPLAVDLGCGDGRDTVELLHRGWRVLGIDGQAEAIDRLQSRPDLTSAELDRLETQVSSFQSAILPINVDLINFSFALPFCPPASFPTLWTQIVQALRIGGQVCGQLFGDRDTWAADPGVTAHTRAQVDQLLQPFDVILLEEEEHPGITALKEEKYWHLFHIVAAKR